MKRFIILLAIPMVLQSCSSMYIPAVRSIPLLEKKGEFQGEAGASTNSAYVNGSYAFTDDIAASINGNLSYGNFTDYYDIYTNKYERDLLDFGGRFLHRYGEVSVGKMNMLPNFPIKLEVFGGAGVGRATEDTDELYHNNNYKSDYYSFFGQGNFGLKKRIVEAGISIRLAYSMFNYAVNLNEGELYKTQFDVFHVEPVFFVRIGKSNLKAVFRTGVNLTLPINPVEEYEMLGFNSYNGKLDYTIFHFSVGLSYRIGGSKK